MEMLQAVAGVWFALVVLAPLQLAYALGPVWTVMLLAGIVFAVLRIRAYRRDRAQKEIKPIRRKR